MAIFSDFPSFFVWYLILLSPFIVQHSHSFTFTPGLKLAFS